MLVGQYTAKMSLKGRVAFPKKFRDILGDKLVVTRGYEGCLIVVSQKSWKTLLQGTENRPFVFAPIRDTLRFLLGNASLIELDDQGRFVVPQHLREYAKFGEEVVFVGLQRYVEIWEKGEWKKRQKYLEENIDQITKQLAEEKDG